MAGDVADAATVSVLNPAWRNLDMSGAQGNCKSRSKTSDTRALLRQIYNTEVDLIPDQQSKTLAVRFHHLFPQIRRSVG